MAVQGVVSQTPEWIKRKRASGLLEGRANGEIGSRSRTGQGNRGEMMACKWLKSHGCEVERAAPREKYDLLVNGKKVEVKSAIRNPKGTWVFEFKKHQIGFTEIVIYVLRDRKIFIVAPKSVQQCVTISEQRLQTQWLPYIGNIAPLVRVQ